MAKYFLFGVVLIASILILNGIKLWAIFLIISAIWVFIGFFVIIGTTLHRRNSPKVKYIFVLSGALYLAQFTVFIMSHQVSGMYNFSGHGYSAPSSKYWFYTILILGLASFSTWVTAIYIKSKSHSNNLYQQTNETSND